MKIFLFFSPWAFIRIAEYFYSIDFNVTSKVQQILMVASILFLFFAANAHPPSCRSLFDALSVHVRSVTDTLAKCSGPNCHNAVLYWHKLSQDLTLTRWR